MADRTPEYGYTDARSLLDMLFYYYTMENPIDCGVIRCQLDTVNMYLKKLPVEDSDKIFDVVTDLIGEHEKIAFLAGVQVGVRLFWELEQEDPQRAL